MKEQSIGQRILEVAREYVSQVGRQRGDDLYLVIGVRCAARRDALQMQWDIVERGLLAEEARHHFDRALFVLQCSQCGAAFELTEGALICPLCGSTCLSLADRNCYEVTGEQQSSSY